VPLVNGAGNTGAPATPRLVEFYNAAQDHYFITAAPNEIADLDAGAHPGRERTGLAFDADAPDARGASAVCRFYIPPALGDSHFYSASAEECSRGRSSAYLPRSRRGRRSSGIGMGRMALTLAPPVFPVGTHIREKSAAAMMRTD
jgi:hypothetical protein